MLKILYLWGILKQPSSSILYIYCLFYKTIMNVYENAFLLQEHEGATLLVSANFSVVSIRNIYLEFQEVYIGEIS